MFVSMWLPMAHHWYVYLEDLVMVDVPLGHRHAQGRIVMELFADQVPRTAENFRCTWCHLLIQNQFLCLFNILVPAGAYAQVKKDLAAQVWLICHVMHDSQCLKHP